MLVTKFVSIKVELQRIKDRQDERGRLDDCSEPALMNFGADLSEFD